MCLSDVSIRLQSTTEQLKSLHDFLTKKKKRINPGNEGILPPPRGRPDLVRSPSEDPTYVNPTSLSQPGSADMTTPVPAPEEGHLFVFPPPVPPRNDEVDSHSQQSSSSGVASCQKKSSIVLPVPTPSNANEDSSDEEGSDSAEENKFTKRLEKPESPRKLPKPPVDLLPLPNHPQPPTSPMKTPSSDSERARRPVPAPRQRNQPLKSPAPPALPQPPPPPCPGALERLYREGKVLQKFKPRLDRNGNYVFNINEVTQDLTKCVEDNDFFESKRMSVSTKVEEYYKKRDTVASVRHKRTDAVLPRDTVERWVALRS